MCDPVSTTQECWGEGAQQGNFTYTFGIVGLKWAVPCRPRVRHPRTSALSRVAAHHTGAAGCFEILKKPIVFKSQRDFYALWAWGFPLLSPAVNVTAAVLCSAAHDSHCLLILEEGSGGCCGVVSEDSHCGGILHGPPAPSEFLMFKIGWDP